MHHREIWVLIHTSLEQLAESGVMDKVRIVRNAQIEEFKGSLAVVVEGSFNLGISKGVVFLKELFDK